MLTSTSRATGNRRLIFASASPAEPVYQWRMVRAVVLVLAASALGACAPAAAPVSTSPRDPSNPAAAEGAPPPTTAAPQATAGATAKAYACPMHPGVREASPGRCPTCGMHLVAQP